jgi:hypothetical protein
MSSEGDLKGLRRSVEDLADEFETRRLLAYDREGRADKQNKQRLGDQEYGAHMAWQQARDAIKRVIDWK